MICPRGKDLAPLLKEHCEIWKKGRFKVWSRRHQQNWRGMRIKSGSSWRVPCFGCMYLKFFFALSLLRRVYKITTHSRISGSRLKCRLHSLTHLHACRLLSHFKLLGFLTMRKKLRTCSWKSDWSLRQRSTGIIWPRNRHAISSHVDNATNCRQSCRRDCGL